MASQAANEYWEYDAHHQRYSHHVYDYNQQRWAFLNWEPVGFQPPQQPRPPPPTSQTTTTTQTFATQPSFPQANGTYDDRQRSDSVTSPGTGVRAAAAGPAGYSVSYGNVAQQLYGSGSAGPSSSQASPWPNSSSTYQSGQSYAMSSGYSTHPQPGTSMNVSPTLNYGGSMPKGMPRGRGQSVNGTWKKGTGSRKEEKVDASYSVRDRKFFHDGRVFSVIMNETAGATPNTSTTRPDATDYNSSKSINTVVYKDNYVHTQVRRFIVVRAKREFCYAIPIFTYSGRATTKRGVHPSEHGIAYSWGQQAQLLPAEGGITKPSIAIVMAKGVADLDKASRIYYGIMHPIQFNVKVKEIGYVPQQYMPTLIGNWKEEEDNDAPQSAHVTANADIAEEDEGEGCEADDDVENNNNDDDDEYEDDTTQAGQSSAANVSQDMQSITYSMAYMKSPSHQQ